VILRHLEGIGTIKKFGFKLVLFFLIASPIIASEITISERPDFEKLVKDKKLERFLISLSVTGDGKIEGSAAGRDVLGDWNWIDGYFCRTLMWGERELKYNCQKVTFDGRRLRFISDRGAGQSASFALR
tara:strand:- start:840 stop:1226 length:387 start_codon:yes stop_codon:yes gene_type:complete